MLCKVRLTWSSVKFSHRLHDIFLNPIYIYFYLILTVTLTSSIIQFMETVSYLTLDGDLTRKCLFLKTLDEDMV